MVLPPRPAPQIHHWVWRRGKAAAVQHGIGEVDLATVGLGVVFRHGEDAAGDGFAFNFVGGQHRGAGDDGGVARGLGERGNLSSEGSGEGEEGEGEVAVHGFYGGRGGEGWGRWGG